MQSVRRTAGLTGLLSLLMAASAAAQGAVHTVAASGAECTACRLRLERVVTLGDSAGAGLLGPNLVSVARDSRGRFLVVTDPADGFGVYTSSGRFVRRIPLAVPVPPLAPGDSSPGEQRGEEGDSSGFVAVLTVTAGDTVRVLEADRRIKMVLAPQDGRYAVVRREPLEVPAGVMLGNALWLRGGEVLIPGNLADRNRVGYPLHIVGVDGGIRASLGAEVARWVPGEEHPSGTRRLAPADSGSVWAAEVTRYRIERWSLAGDRELTIERQAPWFPPFVAFRPISPEEPPQSWLLGVWEDPAGRLWTLVGVAARDWSAGLRRVPREGGADRYVVQDPEAVFDTIIEVFDPACGRLLASERVPSFLLQKIDGDYLAGWRISPAGDPRLDVWNVELHQPQEEVAVCTTSRS